VSSKGGRGRGRGIGTGTGTGIGIGIGTGIGIGIGIGTGIGTGTGIGCGHGRRDRLHELRCHHHRHDDRRRYRLYPHHQLAHAHQLHARLLDVLLQQARDSRELLDLLLLVEEHTEQGADRGAVGHALELADLSADRPAHEQQQEEHALPLAL
jgi:hypothetical protein